MWSSGRRLSRTLGFWLLQASGWAAFALMMLGYALSSERPQQAIFDVLLLVLRGFGLTTLYRYFYRHWRRHDAAPIRLAVLVPALALAGGPLWFETQVALTWMAAALLPSLVHRPVSFRFIPLDTRLFEAFVLLSWSLLYFGVHGWMSLQLERGRAVRAEALAQAARLSDFLRLRLQTVERPQITVAEEIKFVGHYLDIQQIRVAPHAPRGCFAQAWSVGEVLRAWLHLEQQKRQAVREDPRHGD